MDKQKVYVQTFLYESEHNEKGYFISYDATKAPYKKPGYETSRILLAEEEVEIHTPTFDPREALLASLRGEEESIKADYHAKLVKVQDKISQLLALEVLP